MLAVVSCETNDNVNLQTKEVLMSAILGMRPIPAAFVVLTGAATIVAGVYFAFSEIMKADRRQQEIVWGPGSCPVTDRDSYANLVVECDFKRYPVWDTNIKMSYAYNPGPLNCSVTRGGSVGCDLRPFKPALAQ